MRSPSVLLATLNAGSQWWSAGNCLLHSIWCLSNSDKQWVQHVLVSALFMCIYTPACRFADMAHVCSALFTRCDHWLCLCLLGLCTHTYLFPIEGQWTRPLAGSFSLGVNGLPLSILSGPGWITPSVFLSLFPTSIWILQKWDRSVPLCSQSTCSRQLSKQNQNQNTCSHITSILGLIIFCLQRHDSLNLILSLNNWKD